MSPVEYALLFAAAIGAGFIDAIAGGGGLISIPSLLAVGLPPQIALATNKAQSTWGTLMAVTRYHRAGLIHWPEMPWPVAITFIASIVGTWTVTRIENDVLTALVPWLLLGIAVYTLFSPRMGQQEAKARLRPFSFALIFGSLIGFYDGFFGPGTGSFWTIASISILGLELKRATAYTKVVNLTSNAASLIAFLVADLVRFDIAFVMMGGQLIGARLGAGLAIRHGAPFIRIMFILVVLALVAKLLWDQCR